MAVFRGVFIFGLLMVFLGGCSPKNQLADPYNAIYNQQDSTSEPYVILISMDGFRWDYVEKYAPPNLSRFANNGIAAEGLVPCYPSKTFTNHYAIATGMYPDHHGLVNNSFYDREKGLIYRMGKRELVEDGSWYGGTPLWVLAEKSGLKTASFFFVGTEADIQGVNPTYYKKYDGSIPNAERINQAIEWLKLPAKDRPRLITMYFSDMDDVGHRASPMDDKKLGERLSDLDKDLGVFFKKLEALPLNINIILVSDHGMLPVEISNLVAVEQFEDDDRYITVNNGALAHIYLNEGVSVKEVLSDIQMEDKPWKVYATADLPYFEIPPTNPRWGDILVVPDSGFYMVNVRTLGMRKMAGQSVIGEHGFDTSLKDMQGIFYAGGPLFRKGMTIPAFKNIHIYPLVCHILGLTIPEDVDGRLEVLMPILE
jgi:predicted AlkP superfamily pyrophosphatase or phosphodiesterase